MVVSDGWTVLIRKKNKTHRIEGNLVTLVPERSPVFGAHESIVLHQPKVLVSLLHLGVDGLDVGVQVVDTVGVRDCTKVRLAEALASE
jgi:hypothetical protein